MSQTMLQLVQQTTAELNLAIPNYVAGNTNQDVQQVLALMNRTGYDLVKEYDWQSLQLEYRFYTDAVTFVGDTVSNQSYNIIVTGNATALDNTYSITGTGINQDTYVEAVTFNGKHLLGNNGDFLSFSGALLDIARQLCEILRHCLAQALHKLSNLCAA